MRWCLILLVLCGCATTQTLEGKQSLCEEYCNREHDDCTNEQPHFWEYCDQDYNECLEYCY
ncbi:MAG TPA: hypothetical protein ENI36_02200 [Thermoplasmatales archaeon]|nr:hypothetical protein [Thermoplasmatales archaeon]